MIKNEFDEAVAMGRANLETIEIVRRHCRNARVELVHGNSPVGHSLGLPMGMLQLRCEFAPPPSSSSHNALSLAVDFYRSNCVGCSFRKASGEMPNLATVVADLDEQEAMRREADDRDAAERAKRHLARQERRRLAVANEGYVIRDIASWLDELDAPFPRGRPPESETQSAGPRLVESARHAPELFSKALVETLLGLATDSAEPAAFLAIRELVRAQKCPARLAVEAALAALVAHPEPEGVRLLGVFAPELRPDDLPAILDRLIEMASNQNEPWGSQPVVDGILAAGAVDLPAVTNRIGELLESDDEARRGAAADAAAALLSEDAKE